MEGQVKHDMWGSNVKTGKQLLTGRFLILFGPKSYNAR